MSIFALRLNSELLSENYVALSVESSTFLEVIVEKLFGGKVADKVGL